MIIIIIIIIIIITVYNTRYFQAVKHPHPTGFDFWDRTSPVPFPVVLPVPRLRGRLGQVRCRKASFGCFGGRSFQNYGRKHESSAIPGAELPKPAEFCTVAILKRWLSCRGAKVSGNRKDLTKRLDYEPCNVNYLKTIVTFAIEVNSLQTAVESFIF